MKSISDLSRIKPGGTSVDWECFLCWRVTDKYVHTGTPWYEATSRPSGIVLRCCEVGAVMNPKDMDHLGDIWLDAQIKAGRAAVGRPQLGGKAVKAVKVRP
jgi:hypothetical protein